MPSACAAVGLPVKRELSCVPPLGRPAFVGMSRVWAFSVAIFRVPLSLLLGSQAVSLRRVPAFSLLWLVLLVRLVLFFVGIQMHKSPW